MAFDSAVETGDHRFQHLIGIKPVELERMAGLLGQQCEVGELRAAIALTKGMNRIQLRREMCGLVSEFLKVEIWR